jgi:hypothetical protein
MVLLKDDDPYVVDLSQLVAFYAGRVGQSVRRRSGLPTRDDPQVLAIVTTPSSKSLLYL